MNLISHRGGCCRCQSYSRIGTLGKRVRKLRNNRRCSKPSLFVEIVRHENRERSGTGILSSSRWIVWIAQRSNGNLPNSANISVSIILRLSSEKVKRSEIRSTNRFPEKILKHLMRKHGLSLLLQCRMNSFETWAFKAKFMNGQQRSCETCRADVQNITLSNINWT